MTDFPPQVESFPGLCSECKTETLVVNAYAVTLGHSERFTPCADCLEKVRTGELRALTRRLYVAGDLCMFQLLLPGQAVDNPQATRIEGRAAELIAELSMMVRDDPHRGTEFEEAFLTHTKERTRQIGWELFEIGGHNLMLAAHNIIRQLYGPSARSLEVAWDSVGEWFD